MTHPVHDENRSRARRVKAAAIILALLALGMAAPFAVAFTRAVPCRIAAVNRALNQHFPEFAAVQALFRAD